MTDVVKYLIVLFLQLKEEGSGKKKEIAINGSPKFNVPADKFAFSNMFKKENREHQDTQKSTTLETAIQRYG